MNYKLYIPILLIINLILIPTYFYVHIKANNQKQVHQAFQTALSENDDYKVLCGLLLGCLNDIEQKDFAQAQRGYTLVMLEAFSKKEKLSAEEFNSVMLMTHDGLSQLYLKLNQFEKVEHHSKQALEINCTDIELQNTIHCAANFRLGLLLSARNQHKEAIPYLEYAVKKIKDEHNKMLALFWLGNAYFELNQNDNAINCLKVAAKSTYTLTSYRAYELLGDIYACENKLEQAKEQYEIASSQNQFPNIQNSALTKLNLLNNPK